MGGSKDPDPDVKKRYLVHGACRLESMSLFSRYQSGRWRSGASFLMEGPVSWALSLQTTVIEHNNHLEVFR